MSVRRVAVAAVLICAVLASATAPASASHPAVKLRLGLVPLQTAQLGPAGASLALNFGSGTTRGGIVFVVCSVHSTLSSRKCTTSHGAIRGYSLDYGDPFTGSTGVMEIRTSVAEFRNRLDAKKGLASARVLDAEFEPFFLGSTFVDVTVNRVKPEPLGQRRFGYRITQTAPNLNPIVRLDEQVVAGRFVLDLTVTAGSASAAEHVAPHLMHVLHRRLLKMLEGHPVGNPVKLPREPHVGQAPGGPDLSTLILQPTDVGQSHAVNLDQGYEELPHALSDFDMYLDPAGTYDDLQQQIAWWPTATEATYGEIYGASNPFFRYGIFISIGLAARAASGGGETVTPVDLSFLDDPATGYLVTGDGESQALVTLTNGQAGESIVGYKDSGTLDVSDVQNLAQAAADRLDAGLGP